MKKVLLAFNDQLEQQSLLLSELSDRLSALEQGVKFQWSYTEDDLDGRLKELRKASATHVEAVRHQHEELRELLSQLQS